MGSLKRLRLMFMVVLCCILMSALESSPSDHGDYEGSRNGVKREKEDLVARVGGRGGGGNGGESGGREENGNSNNNNGGAGVIPVYAAAGAAKKHHNNGHHSAESSQVLVLGISLIPIFMA